MLVLSRKNHESVVVGGAGDFQGLLKVTVLGIKGTNVKLGFEIDASVPVHRWEVWERINAHDQPALSEAGEPCTRDAGQKVTSAG
ncbi:MAG: carbon storage regulator [Planctomycetota bacterium]